MLASLHLLPYLGVLSLAFPPLIALSGLLTKQHYLLDLPAGAARGWVVHGLYAAV